MSDSDAAAAVPRVLQYTYGGGQISGIDTYLLEVYRAIDKQVVQFDFLFRYRVPYPPEVVHELESMGARVFELGVNEKARPIRRQWQEIRALRHFMKGTHYPVVEINMTALFMCLSMLLSAIGVPGRIVHAHDSVPCESTFKTVLKRAFTPLLNWLATSRWACSRGAAEYLFSRRIVRDGRWSLIPNAIDARRFAFDPRVREEVRQSWGVGDSVCVGMVARFTRQKNHQAGVNAFASALTLDPNLWLILVGDGELRSDVESQVAAMGLADRVRFLGERLDVPEVLCGLDLIIAPSRHEGYPITALEAQASGLPLIASEAFPPEADVSGKVIFMPAHASTREWAETIRDIRPNQDRSTGVDAVETAGFDRVSAARGLEVRYRKVLAP